MPVYSYRCNHCGVQFDRHQKFSEEPLQVCPECGEEALRKLYQPVGIVFKGSGFYSTDNRSPSGAPKKKSEKPEKNAEKAKETKDLKDSKPAAETKSASKADK